MDNLYHISRNFVEFGPITFEEVLGFKKRHILTDHDYIRSENAHNWETIAQWIAEGKPEKTTAKKEASSSIRKSPGAKKASKKAALKQDAPTKLPGS